MAGGEKEITISVIIPVRNGGDNFRVCLESLAEAVPAPDEIIVVADGESDGSWRFAETAGAKILRLPVSRGPAAARNLGASRAKGEILLFIDADVTVRPDIVEQVAGAFQNNPGPAALFGSYDDQPAAANFLSQYKNLLHHYVHQSAREEAWTFWGACGAIRREVFLALGGFDETYRHPSIEDIELGYRLRRAGHRIRLDKKLQVKHLKRWGVGSLLKADFFYRALPWTQLILRDRRLISDLNLTLSSRISVILTYGILGSLIAAWWWAGFLAMSAVQALALLFLNARLYRFFQRKRGVRFAMQALPWHWFYYLYSGLAFAGVLALQAYPRNSAPLPATHHRPGDEAVDKKGPELG
ncbi:MAG: glycosyltransferase family 2 protein [Deltaproteobacteria bacterium]|nr:glycosyltransferase family 2 protein [Deltaproteobacteria bacterium]